ncbi:TRAP transporter small permease subunit [Lusitaniella coriacea LEGE 07157]|uniref:TRAP transporter small permease subunit n=1 Tax=Lusitaniella coriacea LEGE 07157 TaxID=945747 RepID=A0A8J7AS50_9CYAN|nr:TRAP transporter small permease subunit [Lusitaniella coriacea]MBE9115301.1 TRAP transporter small permease subunit [Lusitaniella coriacea LEGE 07157]
MQILLKISRLIDSLNEWVGRLAYGLVLLMVGIGVWNVIGRYLGRYLGESLTSNVFIEMQWYLFAIIFLLGAAYALKHDEHVRVDLFYKDWSQKKKALANLIGTFLFLLPFCAMAIYFSWNPILNSWKILEQSPDPDGLPRYPIKSIVIISFALLFLQGISEAIKNWVILKSSPQNLPVEDTHEL